MTVVTTRRTVGRTIIWAALFATGCGAGDATTEQTSTNATDAPTTTIAETTSTTIEPVDPVFAQLCGVLNAALGGEFDVAKSTFDHGPLHTLADETIPVDRAAAARLLEAKEAVESGLAAPDPDLATVTADLEALTEATAQALVVTGTPVAPTCELESP